MHLPASSHRPSASNSIIRKILSARYQKKTLFHDDFVNGVNTVSFLIPNGLRGGFCHRIRVFDRNGRLIANR